MSRRRELISFYKDWLGFKFSYELMKLSADNNEFINHERFLFGIQHDNKTREKNIEISIGNNRVDIPVWFGDIDHAEQRVLVIALEPKNTDKDFIIEKINSNLFSSAFGVDRWNLKSSIKGRPQNKFYRGFMDSINEHSLYLHFTNIIKRYSIHSPLKSVNDRLAKKNFKGDFDLERSGLLKEIELINPDIIICIGTIVYSILEKEVENIPLYSFVQPTFGGEESIKKKLNQLIFSPANTKGRTHFKN